MDSEFVVCDLEAFRQSYLPFNPSEEDIQCGIQTLLNQDQASYDTQHNLRWKTFAQPSHCDGTETAISSSLQGIFNTLTKCTLNGRHCNFVFSNHPNKSLSSDIPGCNHKTDGSFIRLGRRNPDDVHNTPGAVSTADIGAPLEVKTNNLRRHTYDDRVKVLGAANHIMNDDIRRLFTFGITIGDDQLTLWYFSRSHSVKSAPFNFIQDPHSFTAVALSFMFSSDEEMGYDRHVTRSADGSYIYCLKRQGGEDRYFQTGDLISGHRSLCITGRMTRVWKAIEVDQKGTPKTGKPVVLKDVWLDATAQTEKRIQDDIFHDIRAVSESALADPHACLGEFPADMRAHLERILASNEYREYFLRIECDYRGETTKPLAPSAVAARGLFAAPLSTGTPVSLTSRSLNDPTRKVDLVMSSPMNRKRQYVSRRQYRVVYNEVCDALHDLDSLRAMTKVSADCLTALQLMYCAGWVHRDVSSGNILGYNVEGTMRGKLADLEYAKKFTSTSGSSDPKTGTPFFMPFEIHGQQYLSFPIQQHPPARFGEKTIPRTPISPPVRFNFQHDIESLWWVLLWIITQGVDHPQSREFAAGVFQNQLEASAERASVITVEDHLAGELGKCLHPSVQEYGDLLVECLTILRTSYIYREHNNKIENPASYAQIHGMMYEFLQAWRSTLDGNDDVPIKLRSKPVPHTNDSMNQRHGKKRGPPGDDSDYKPPQENRGPERSRRSV